MSYPKRGAYAVDSIHPISKRNYKAILRNQKARAVQAARVVHAFLHSDDANEHELKEATELLQKRLQSLVELSKLARKEVRDV